MITVEIDFEIFHEASNWEIKGIEMALAIVLKTWGSSPRQPGSMMLIREDGHLVGSVSGGCVEGAVIVGSQKIMKEDKTELKEFRAFQGWRYFKDEEIPPDLNKTVGYCQANEELPLGMQEELKSLGLL